MLSPTSELYGYGLRNPLRTASLTPTLMGAYKPTPLTFKQRIKNMEIGYHATIITLRLLQAVLFIIGIIALMNPDVVGNLIIQLFK